MTRGIPDESRNTTEENLFHNTTAVRLNIDGNFRFSGYPGTGLSRRV